MSTWWRRGLALIVSASMVFGSMPAQALGEAIEEVEPIEDVAQVETADEEPELEVATSEEALPEDDAEEPAPSPEDESIEADEGQPIEIDSAEPESVDEGVLTVQSAETWLWPVPDWTGGLSRGFSSGHDGQDILQYEGAPIVASRSGVVARVLTPSTVDSNWVGYGYGVVINHGDGYYSHYAHMSGVMVSEGQSVARGQQIGTMGATGNATGTHLHFSIATSVYGGGGRINNNRDVIAYDYSNPFTSDTTKPTCTDFHVAEINGSTFTAMAKVTDNVGLASVRYVVWTTANGQDDIKWYDGHCTDNNDIYWARIPWSEHGNARGKYEVQIYAYDTAGNKENLGLFYDFDHTSPSIQNLRVGEFREGAFTVMSTVTDPNNVLSKVQYAIWSDKDGQDDLIWHDAYCTDGNDVFWSRVSFAEHNGERGEYYIHAYAWNTAGQQTSTGLKVDFDAEGPIISNVRVTDVSTAGYTVSCDVRDDGVGVSRVQFPVWTMLNDQDDIASEWWRNPAASGKKRGDTYTFRVNASDHNNERGVYATHIYAYDTFGNYTCVSAPAVDLSQAPAPGTTPPSKPKVNISGANISAIAAKTYTGSAIKPAVTVTLDGSTLVADTDYAVSYANNVNAGTATVTVTGKGGYTGSVSRKFTIARAPVAVPKATNYTYDGKAHTGIAKGTGYALSGTATATNAGAYEATATPDANHKWADGTTTAKKVSWRIAKAKNPIAAKAVARTASAKTLKSKAVAIKKPSVSVSKAQGKVKYAKASGAKCLSISKTTGRVTVKKGTRKGTYKIKVKVTAAGNANYKAGSKTVTCKVTVK